MWYYNLFTLFIKINRINEFMLIDTHCHLYYDEIKNNLSDVLNRANEANVTRFICAGTNINTSKQCLEITEEDDNIFASCGVHPHDSKDVQDGYLDQIYEMMEYESMIAIGELGLDYFKNISDKETQKEVFRSQMDIAQELDKPVIIHNRDADQDILEILSDFPDVIGVSHCFSSTLDTAKAFLDLGYYISFSGNITFKNSHLPEVAKSVPLDRVLIETDSPYLSPEPYRGKPNEPARVIYVAKKLSEIYDIDYEEIAKQTSNNASEIFRLP